jgi:hypothetical protein
MPLTDKTLEEEEGLKNLLKNTHKKKKKKTFFLMDT